jgi:hypothetical protein
MQKLEVYQSLWATEQRCPGQPEIAFEERFSTVKQAGFAGICLDPAIDEISESLALQSLFEQHNLGCMVNAFPAKVKELKPLLEMAKELNACAVNVIGGVMPVSVAGAIPVLYRWMEYADDLDMPLLIETHRDGILNDLYSTLEIIDAIPELRLCADLSHFVVDREFKLPMSNRDQGFIHRILERSDCLQGRVASREQIQIQIEFPQHQEWVAVFKGWWRQGLLLWRRRNREDATFRFLCELGPPSYAITDADGNELSDRWQEALTIKRWIESIWADLDKVVGS